MSTSLESIQATNINNNMNVPSSRLLAEEVSNMASDERPTSKIEEADSSELGGCASYTDDCAVDADNDEDDDDQKPSGWKKKIFGKKKIMRRKKYIKNNNTGVVVDTKGIPSSSRSDELGMDDSITASPQQHQQHTTQHHRDKQSRRPPRQRAKVAMYPAKNIDNSESEADYQ